MSREKPVYPDQLFDRKTLEQAYSFIDSLSKDDIMRFRSAYRREMNQSNDDNVLPETTLEQRRCFMYLTYHYEPALSIYQ